MNTDFVVSHAAKPFLVRQLAGVAELPTKLGRGKSPVIVLTNADEGWENALVLVEHAKGKARDVLVALLEQNAERATAAMSMLAGRHFNAFSTRDPQTLKRVLHARKSGGADARIAAASVIGDRLLVWSCELHMFECAFADVSALANLSASERTRFEIDDDGSFIRWPAKDIDLDLSAIRYVADPQFRKQTDRKKRETFRRYGRAIKALREEKGLRQSQILGLDVRQVRRLESGEHVPHPDTIARLAAAHGMTENEYLAALAAHK